MVAWQGVREQCGQENDGLRSCRVYAHRQPGRFPRLSRMPNSP